MRNTTKINSLIDAIGKNALAMRNDIQDALIEAACFAQFDRNTDPAIRLFAAVGNETHVAAMSHWITTYAPIYFRTDEETGEKVLKLSDKSQKEFKGLDTQFEEQLAKATPWYDFNKKANRPANIWDNGECLSKLDEYMLKVIKTAKKNDIQLGDTLARAHAAMLAEISKVYEIVEA